MNKRQRFYRTSFIVGGLLALPMAGTAQGYQGYANQMQRTLGTVVRAVQVETRASNAHIQTILERHQANLQTETRANVDGEYRLLLNVYTDARDRLDAQADRMDAIVPPEELTAVHTRLARTVREYAGYTGSLADLVGSSLCGEDGQGDWSCTTSDRPNGGMELLLGYIAMQEMTFATLRRTHEQLRTRLAEHLVTVPKLEASGS
jgi:hypothetical protein